MSMTKADLVERVTESIARTSGPMISKKDCARVVDAFLDAIKDALKEPALNDSLVTVMDQAMTLPVVPAGSDCN